MAVTYINDNTVHSQVIMRSVLYAAEILDIEVVIPCLI